MTEEKKSEKRKRPLHRGEIKGEKLPNDYKKGNRSNSRRETAHILETTSIAVGLDKEIKERAVKYVEGRKAARKYTQGYLTGMFDRVRIYVAECLEGEEPLTISGLILRSGMSKFGFTEAKNGNFDYLLGEYFVMEGIEERVDGYIDGVPYMDNEGERILLVTYSELVERCLLMVEEQTERRLYEKGRVGDIFALKSKHDWQDDRSPQTVNQTLVIASEEQARKAIEALK